MAALNRAGELAANLTEVRARIDAACRQAGRVNDVTLIAVTKTWPLSDVRLLRDLGVEDFGENRDQEAAAKAAGFASEDGRSARWHFIGQLQSNKARSVVRYAAMVHTADRLSLVAALKRAAHAPLDCLVQFSVDGDPHRGGVTEEGLLELAAQVSEPLRLRGIMAVSPLTVEPARAFTAVARAHDLLLSRFPQATIRCIGMSDDFETAVEYGATHVRVGSALLGARPVI
jgi:pyridoxal phosphate enzyme (YggS family)